MRSADRHLSDRQLVAKIDRELTGPRLAVVDAHLAHCERCRLRAERVLATALTVRTAVRAEVDDVRQRAGRDRLVRAMELERAEIDRRSWWRTPTVLTPLTAAAAVVIAVFILTNPPEWGAAGVDLPDETRVLPIAGVTPGAVSPLTAARLCAGERPSRVVAPAVAHQVLGEYGMQDVAAGEYELDALITPELGGTVAAENLWPQRYTGGLWTAYVKDELEMHLRDLVCAGDIELATAQREIATDWIAAYKRYFRRDRPAQSVRAGNDEPELIIASQADDVVPRFRLLIAVSAAALQ